jgi:transposase
MSSSLPNPHASGSGTQAPAEPDTSQPRNASAAMPPATELPLRPSRRRRRLAKPDEPTESLTGAQRLLLLDTWRRSGLPAGDFAPLVGVSKHTLYSWKHKFETEGPVGLEDKPRGGPTGSRLPEVTKRTILMLKQDNPDWGCERTEDHPQISQMTQIIEAEKTPTAERSSGPPLSLFKSVESVKSVDDSIKRAQRTNRLYCREEQPKFSSKPT